jgi:hypothetical protein
MARSRKTHSADETRAWVIALASQPPNAIGVIIGRDKKGPKPQGELWSLKALHQCVIDHGWKQGYVVGAERLRT